MSSSVAVREHQACAFAYNIKCSYDMNLDKLVKYRCEDASKQFVYNIIKDCKEYFNKHLSKIFPLKYV